MTDYKHLYPMEKMSKVLRVSRGGYYRWTHRSVSARKTSVAAFNQACTKRPVTNKLLFHSDRGIQYASEELTSLLDKNPNITRSVSRK
jgi:transposase InsO family protein